MSNNISDSRRYFQTWKRFKYRFANDRQRELFRCCCLNETKALFHFEIIDMLETMGVAGWKKGVELEPRSVYKPELLYPSCKKWEIKLSYQPQKVALAKAVKLVEKDFAILKDSVMPITLEEAAMRMAFRPDGQRKSAGLPYLCKKDQVVSQTIARAKHVLIGKAPEPCIGIHRGKKRNEARLVWAYPYEIAAIEAQFQIPLMERLLKTNGVHPIVYLSGDRIANHSRMDRARVWADRILCLDYSAFDSSVSAQLLTYAWRIMRSWFVHVDEKAWTIIERYFATSPILMPDGFVYSGRKGGVPSGSCFTQIIDSIVNAIAIRYIEQRLALDVNTYGVLGDDSYISVSSRSVEKEGFDIDFHAVSGVLAELGVRMNVDKSNQYEPTGDFHFLGVNWKHDHTVSRPLDELLHRIICPEKWSPKPEVFIEGTNLYTKEYKWWFRARVQSYMVEAGDNIHALQALINFTSWWNRWASMGAEDSLDWKSWWEHAHKGFCKSISQTMETEEIIPGYVDKSKDYLPNSQDLSPRTQLRSVAK